jgi:hypothetical protein
MGYENKVGNRLKEKLMLHAEAIELYYDRKYKNASRLFKDLYELDKSDTYYKVMLSRIMELQNGE